MADRPPTRLPPPRGVAKTSSRGPTAASSASTNVRRNLFQSQLTRRPTAGTGGSSSVSSSASASASAETLRLDPDIQLQPPSEPSASSATPPAFLDIVIRDKNGEVELEDPPTPVVDADEVALDAHQEGERERQRLAEAVKQHQIGQNSIPAQPEGE